MAAAALEELLVALLPAPDSEAVGVDVVLGPEEEAVAVTFGGVSWPHAVFSVDLHCA